MKRKVALLCAVVVLLLVGSVIGSLFTKFTLAEPASVPSVMSYQGTLLASATDNAVADGQYQFVFSVYSDNVGGPPLWQETQTVTVQKGLFSILLGSSTPLNASVFDGSPRYLGVKVGTDNEMTPRQLLASVPYAFQAMDAETLDGIDSSQFAAASHSHAEYVSFTGAPYRWMVFSTWSDGSSGWYASNNATMFGGVNPSSWSDANAQASQMSSDKEVLRTLFTRKGYGGKNAVIVADEWVAYSSSNGKLGAVLFRIRNTTASAINWPVSVYMTSYSIWSERASIALNGVDIWNSGSSTRGPSTSPISVTLSIPPNRTSTAIFVAGSGPATAPISTYISVRSLYLAFTDSLQLPTGLEFVDDLDTATGGWEQ